MSDPDSQSKDQAEAAAPSAPQDGESSKAVKKPGSSKAAAKPKFTEEQLDAPSKQTLFMLGAISLSTLVFWAAGRAACNYHVPGESLTPRSVSLEDKTRTPKDVGIEFAQALSRADFATAKSLSVGSALGEVNKQETSCTDCDARKEMAKKILSVASVEKATPVDSFVSVRTVGGPGGEKVRLLGIERSGRDWRVSRFFPSAEGVTLREPQLPTDTTSSTTAAE